MSFMDLLDQRTSVMVRESLGRSCGYLMTDMQALVESQQSGTFSLPYNAYIMVMNNRCLIQASLTLTRRKVFLLFVSVQPGRDRNQWKLIYAGELSREGVVVDEVGNSVYFPK